MTLPSWWRTHGGHAGAESNSSRHNVFAIALMSLEVLIEHSFVNLYFSA